MYLYPSDLFLKYGQIFRVASDNPLTGILTHFLLPVISDGRKIFKIPHIHFSSILISDNFQALFHFMENGPV